jgi:6-phosphogluconolactonase/glucosamine-6-phosphate isomerase/deaminase
MPGRELASELLCANVVWTGLGPEAHTASLFPGTKALHETRRLVVSTWAGQCFTDRITLTSPVLNNASGVVFLVSGEDKALALKAVLDSIGICIFGPDSKALMRREALAMETLA